MLISSSGVLGTGTLKQARGASSGEARCIPGFSEEESRLFNLMGMNFRGNTLGNRLIHFIVPKKHYGIKGNENVYPDMMYQYADDARRLQLRGFKDNRGKHWWLCFVGNLGDLPQQVKTGGLKRSFNNVIKSPEARTFTGICVVCPAGQQGFDFENMSLCAPFFNHMYEDEPWDHDAAIFDLVRFTKNFAKIFRIDIWHGFHLGSGMVFVASGLVEAMELIGGSISHKLEIMNAKLDQFKLKTDCGDLSFSALTQKRLGWSSIDTYPIGAWQKASDTVQLLRFLIDILEEPSLDLQPNTILYDVLKAGRAIDFVFSSLYGENIFVFGDKARDIAVAGLRYLQVHMSLVRQCHQLRKNRFLQMPKLHGLHHVFATMQLGCYF